MAEILLRPDPSSFPPGTTVKVYARALPERGGQLIGQPPGALLSEPVVAANGSLTVTGVEEGHRYVGWAQTGGSDRYLFFEVAEVAPSGGGEPPTATATRKAYIATGIAGAETQSRYAGATASGHPTAGTFVAGDYVIDLSGTVWICTAGGTPGTWASPSGGAGGLLAANNLSDVANVATARGNLLAAPLASPALTGTPTAPTAGALTNTTQLATTAYADGAVGVEKGRAEGVEAAKAPLASPALTGVPTAPTAGGGTSTTQLATTAFAGTAASAAQTAAEAVAALKLAKAANLSDVAEPGESRMNLRVPILSPALCVATANVALEGLQTIDGVTLEDGQVVLLTAQTEAKNNGTWVAHAGAWLRPKDFQTGYELKTSRLVVVLKGTANALSLWTLQGGTFALVIGTGAQTWEKVPTGGGGGSVTLGAITEALVERAQNTNFEPSATKTVMVYLKAELKAENVTVKIEVDGTVIEEPIVKGVASTTPLHVSFLVKAGGKWKIPTNAGVLKIFSTYQVIN